MKIRFENAMDLFDIQLSRRVDVIVRILIIRITVSVMIVCKARRHKITDLSLCLGMREHSSQVLLPVRLVESSVCLPLFRSCFPVGHRGVDQTRTSWYGSIVEDEGFL